HSVVDDLHSRTTRSERVSIVSGVRDDDDTILSQSSAEECSSTRVACKYFRMLTDSVEVRTSERRRQKTIIIELRGAIRSLLQAEDKSGRADSTRRRKRRKDIDHDSLDTSTVGDDDTESTSLAKDRSSIRLDIMRREGEL